MKSVERVRIRSWGVRPNLSEFAVGTAHGDTISWMIRDWRKSPPRRLNRPRPFFWTGAPTEPSNEFQREVPRRRPDSTEGRRRTGNRREEAS